MLGGVAYIEGQLSFFVSVCFLFRNVFVAFLKNFSEIKVS